MNLLSIHRGEQSARSQQSHPQQAFTAGLLDPVPGCLFSHGLAYVSCQHPGKGGGTVICPQVRFEDSKVPKYMASYD